ncbi:MAG: hypothetical protein GYB65_22390, partial [Chloroflexi bacterium]|nr:hypothetical protein [Chloroflexota bacterium]
LVITLLDHLRVMPTGLWSFDSRWTTTPLVFRHPTITLHERFPMTTPSIRQYWWWGMTLRLAPFYLLP